MVKDPGIRNTVFDIVMKIEKQYHPEKIILYGSYAYGNPREDSDIDLLIIKDTDEQPIDRRVAVRRIISDPTRLIPVETIVITPTELKERQRIGDQFLEEIFTKGEVLYRPGDEFTFVYLLKEGLVRQHVLTPQGQDVLFMIYKPDSIFPFVCSILVASMACNLDTSS